MKPLYRLHSGYPLVLLTVIALMQMILLCDDVAAQVDTIRPSPKAVRLREIWRIEGPNEGGGDRVGLGVGSVGDINNDGLSDFAVNWGKLEQWKVYLGKSPAPSTIPSWIVDTAGGSKPLAGDFWGTGRKAVTFATAESDTSGGRTKFFRKLLFFRTEGDTLATAPDLILNYRHSDPPVRFSYTTMLAADLDSDGDDELILFNYLVVRGDSTWPAEIWIYRGGPDFQVGAPSLIIRDPFENTIRGNFYAGIGDFDGDSRLDMVTWIDNTDIGRLRFWWGAPGAPWNWNQPDRIIPTEADAAGGIFYLLDCDGDRIQDLLINSPTGPRLYRSATGKSMRTRSLLIDDSDADFRSLTYGGFFAMGPLNDSSRRYDMIGKVGSSLIAFSGGPNGPDLQYDATHSDNFGVPYGYPTPLSDVNGDGWPDVLFGNYTYFFQSGVALILSGGPYIPRDGVSGVQDLSINGQESAVSIWPIPMRDELHIAWRGDLRRPPARFEVHDITGKLVAIGDADPATGEALWTCSTAPAGVYMLSIYDRDGDRISATRIPKR